ncbi:hypothetical protein N3K66_005580 [Trichothecium roseum]|uniref:Uncharacterized protein n=1 Tax=Trichothecium roseum TaxID=47278 RepID=A0ACC0UZK2_9HYPO|nr:hypothetical protein N3K66_005580 [Trichothecium roseum]
MSTATTNAAVAATAPSSSISNGVSHSGPCSRKRKAGSQNNERLSKRLSLLNIEQNGSKLYVPVEEPTKPSPNPLIPQKATAPPAGDTMEVDDSKHKVYIYNIDDELSSEDDTDNEEGKLIFLPDIDKHLRENRIPPHILANSEGELAGMQLVLYSDPKSLSVPEEKDGVRKAIIEARQRARDKQRGAHGGGMQNVQPPAPTMPPDAGMVDDGEAMDID